MPASDSGGFWSDTTFPTRYLVPATILKDIRFPHPAGQ